MLNIRRQSRRVIYDSQAKPRDKQSRCCYHAQPLAFHELPMLVGPPATAGGSDIAVAPAFLASLR